MATHRVNLDALIPRVSFDATTDRSKASANQRPGDVIRLPDLETWMSKLIRKPDFQRETSAWKPDTVADFIHSYVEGDVVPSVIAWYAPDGTIVIIDGAHRVSALLAWIKDDYGAGVTSNAFWRFNIPEAQKKLAKKASEKVMEKVGDTYAAFKVFLDDNSKAPNEAMLTKARKAMGLKLGIQWIDGNADKAEASFYKINRSGTPIDDTELSVIQARHKPNAIAARALMNLAGGFEYWSDFSEQNKTEITKLTNAIHDILFKPIYDIPIKTADVPIAGSAYSQTAFRMILDAVNYLNQITPQMWTVTAGKQQGAKVMPDETDGTKTVELLYTFYRAAKILSGDAHNGSLGVHPLVYFYSPTGRFQSSAFIAIAGFFLKLDREKKLLAFTKVRERFEDFLVTHRHYVSALVHSAGSRTRPLRAMTDFYEALYAALTAGEADPTKIEESLQQVSSLHALKNAKPRAYNTASRGKRGFPVPIQNYVYINSVIDSPSRCGWCNARMHVRSQQLDHDTRRADGGSNDPKNATPMHPYCNQGAKEAALRKH